jgi:hypothetical protein
MAECRFEPSNETTEIATALRAALATAKPHGRKVSIVLADELARMWHVVPPRGCTRMADLRGAATMRFESLFGCAPAGWKIAADWNVAKPFLAVAAPVALVASLESALRECGARVVELQPQFIAALNQWRGQRSQGAWFGMFQSQLLTLALSDRGTLKGVCTMPVPVQCGRNWLENVVAREALRVGLPRPKVIEICGAAPSGWGASTGEGALVCTLLDEKDAADKSGLEQLARTGIAR